MLDRIATLSCPTVADCGGTVTLRLGYAPQYAGRRRRLTRTVDALRQTCSCALSDYELTQLGARAGRGRIRPALV